MPGFNLDKSARILVLGPHPDDEIGCGGYVNLLASRGHEIFYYYFSDCSQSTIQLGFDPIDLIDELYASCEVLGIPEANIVGLDYPVRRFPEFRQPILEDLVRVRNEIQPSLVFTPNSKDVHQDHSTIAAEALRAFKYSSVLGYEFPWNLMDARLDFIVRMDALNIEAKVRAWACYKTQAARSYSGRETMESLARVRGIQANTEFAECYEAQRVFI